MIKSTLNSAEEGNFKNPKSEKYPMFLSDLLNHSSATVVGIRAGREASKRLSGLGLTPGTKIKRISSAPFHGPIQIEVRKTRLAIGRGLASKILIQEVEGNT